MTRRSDQAEVNPVVSARIWLFIGAVCLEGAVTLHYYTASATAAALLGAAIFAVWLALRPEMPLLSSMRMVRTVVILILVTTGVGFALSTVDLA